MEWSGNDPKTTHYQVEWGQDGGSSTFLPSVGGDVYVATRVPQPDKPAQGTADITWPALTPRTTYRFCVRACNGAACSSYTDWVTAQFPRAGAPNKKVTLYLDKQNPAALLSEATADTSGRFATTVTIPAVKAAPPRCTSSPALTRAGDPDCRRR